MPAELPLPVPDPWFRATTVDTGLGVDQLRTAFPDLFRREPLVVVTHAHLDRMGSAHEFEQVWAHPLEHQESPAFGSLRGDLPADALGLRPHPDAGPHRRLPGGHCRLVCRHQVS
ncbi:hypothetical protein ACEZCY_15600 [Streptacidiphilus sp. N1-12]|uniref:Uncharacterized protein n=2 Tax=Streptacidiphilus alkalitolerans TaxID=3342712 RepID=A0ABV6WF46_9ACTN